MLKYADTLEELSNYDFTEKKYLVKIVYKKNADWFSCYRAFYLFFLFDNKNKIFWKDMLLSCHPNFPLILLRKKLSNFQN